MAGDTLTFTAEEAEGGNNEEPSYTVSVDEALTLSELTGEKEIIVALEGGEPNTAYLFTITVSSDDSQTSLYDVVDGESGSIYGEKKLVLTTDDEGNVSIFVFVNAYGDPLTATLSVEVSTGEVEPNPDPDEPEYPTLTLGEDTVIESLNEVGLTYMLDEDCVAGSWYKLSSDNANVQFSINGREWEAELEFQFGRNVYGVYVRSTDGDLTDVTVTLTETEAPAPAETDITVGEAVEAGPLDFGKKYSIYLEAGTYNVYVNNEKLTSIDGYSEATIEYYNDNFEDYDVIYSDDGNIVVETAGTYYLCVYVEGTFKVEKVGGSETEEPTPAEADIEVGEVVTATDVDENNPPVYSIELEAGTYNVYVNDVKLTAINMASDAMIALDDEGYDVLLSDDGNVAVETAGTYYLFVYVDGTFKVEKV